MKYTRLLLASFVIIATNSFVITPVQAQVNTTASRAEKQLTATDLDMTPECFQQFLALMQEKESRTPAQQKVDSHLLMAAKMLKGQPLPGNIKVSNLALQADMIGRVQVDISCKPTQTLINAIVRSGGEITGVFPEQQLIHAWIPIANAEPLAAFPEVRQIIYDLGALANAGSVTGQGDTTHLAGGAAGARAIYNTTGAGVLVGALSDSNTKQAQSVATGDLPPTSGPEPTVANLPGQTGTASAAEGTAMLEIIHDIAPGAGLRFATAFAGAGQFATNIGSLKTAGCKVIVDDVFYFNEPAFMDGNIAKAVDQVTAAGTLYFSSAGNQGNTSHPGFGASFPASTASVWEGDFVNGGTISLTDGSNTYSGKAHRFATGVNFNTVKNNASGEPTVLVWSDAQGKSANDYDLIITNSTGSLVVDVSNSTQSGTQDPYEAVSAPSNGERIYIIAKGTAAPRMLHLNAFDGNGFGNTLTYVTPGNTHGHSQARDAFCVAAAPATNNDGFGGPYPNAFTATSPFEYFSSDGPRRVFYLNDGTPITPNNFLASTNGGEVRLKPDLTAADGAASSAAFPAGGGFNPFYGTSAAAPHAAAIAALLLSYKSANATAAANVPEGVTIDGSKLTTAEIRTILQNGCIDNTRFSNPVGWDKNTGYGILMPIKALAFITNFADANKIVATTTDTTATIQWNTALSADSIVQYGTTATSLTQTVTGASGVSHSVTVTGLSPKTSYYYRVISKTGASTANSGAIFGSRTRSLVTAPASTLPQINVSGISVTGSAPNVTVQLTVKNNGTVVANSLRVTSATLSGSTTTTSLPTSTANIAVNGTQTIPLTFTGLTSGTKSMTVKGTFTGGGFTLSLRVTVP